MMIFQWCFYTDELLTLLQLLLYWLYWIVPNLTSSVTKLGFCCQKNEAVHNIYGVYLNKSPTEDCLWWCFRNWEKVTFFDFKKL